MRVAVVGDTGIGDRAYNAGFLAVVETMRRQHPDLLLHLGDFAYHSIPMSANCPENVAREVRVTLAADFFPDRIFVPGDNDLPPNVNKPLATGCWDEYDKMDKAFDVAESAGPQPAPYEGTRVIGPALFAVLNSFPWQDPTPWLKPRIDDARKRGLWIIIALHLPPLTTAWHIDQRQTALRQINALQPDLVFSGNQHSYERFHALGPVGDDGKFSAQKDSGGDYKQGQGSIHIVTGGGGAFLRPFADLQGNAGHTAPPDVRDALANRALMNHFLLLDIASKRIEAATYRVCADPAEGGDPRLHPDKSYWRSAPLACEGRPPGADVFESFRILREE